MGDLSDSAVERLIGRAAELETLRAAVDRVVGGIGTTLLVGGEAGIGKTALLDAACAFAQESGLPVLRGAAREFDVRRPFAICADALGLRGETTSAAIGEIAELLRGADHADDAAAFGDWPILEFRIRELLLAILDQRTNSGPLVLALDDLHWADVASLELLHQLAGTPNSAPLLVLATARPLPRSPELATLVSAWSRAGGGRIQLGPLSADACAGLVTRVIGRAASPTLLGRVAAAGGNPLFAVEMLEVLRAEGVLTIEPDGSAGVAPGGWPSSLSLTILDRLSYLGAATVEMLSIASILGTRFTLTELATLTERSAAAVWSRLADAVRAEVLSEQGSQLLFRHELFRQALYEDMPESVRAAMHSDAARVLRAAGAPAATVAEHVLRGTIGTDPDALGWLRAAAAEAAHRSPAIAVELLEAGLRRTDGDEQPRLELLADLAIVVQAAGRHTDSAALCRQVLTAPRRTDRESRLRICLAQSLLVLGELDAARSEVERALRLPELSARQRARSLAWASYVPLYTGDQSGAVAAANRAIEAAGAAGDLTAQATATMTLSHVANFRVQLSAAERLAARAAGMADRAGSGVAHEGTPYLARGLILVDCDRMSEAGEAFRRGMQVAEHFGAGSRVVLAHLATAYRLFHNGDWGDALTEIEAGLALAGQSGLAWQVEPICMRALIAMSRGQLDEARAELAAAEAEAAAGAPQYRVGWVQWTRGALAEATGDTERALVALTEAWQLSQATGMACEYRIFGPDLARVAAAAGDRALAEEVADGLERLAAGNPEVPGLTGAALRARALAAQDADRLVDALGVVRSSPRPLERARSAEETALALAEAGRLAEAGDIAREAAAGYAALGADGAARLARARWRAAGVLLGVRGRRSRPKHGWAALTDTETVIARLVAVRLSNPEIAQRLFLSRRTVATHVSHILAKLSMSSRAEIVAASADGSLKQLGEDTQ